MGIYNINNEKSILIKVQNLRDKSKNTCPSGTAIVLELRIIIVQQLNSHT